MGQDYPTIKNEHEKAIVYITNFITTLLFIYCTNPAA